MERVQLTSSVRTGRGKGVARKLRQQGLIPAILYGGASGTIALSVDSHNLHQFLAKGVAETNVIELSIENAEETKKVQTILKDYQIDPVIRSLVHADFMEVSMDQTLELNVPLELTGEALGVKAGGVLEFVTREVSIECLPADMVDNITIDISSLAIGDSLTVGDLTLDERHTLLTSTDVVIVTVAHPIAEEALEASEEKPVEPEVIQKGKKEEE
jgi:large subunit ribosomal protein L25